MATHGSDTNADDLCKMIRSSPLPCSVGATSDPNPESWQMIPMKRNTMKRNTMKICSLIVLLVLLNGAQVRAADIVPVITGGDWTQHAASGQTEINGTQFTVAFPGLPAGAYTVIVEAAEIYFAQPGQRVMDVSSGPVVIAKGWDVFQEAGGRGERPMGVGLRALLQKLGAGGHRRRAAQERAH